MKRLFVDFIVWGFILWLIGYILGIVLFMAVPPSMIGWIIMPIGILIALWILLKKIKEKSFTQYVLLGICWAAIAIICDYLFIVKIFKPADGYYKLDVYIYYLLTFLLPIIVGSRKTLKTPPNS